MNERHLVTYLCEGEDYQEALASIFTGEFLCIEDDSIEDFKDPETWVRIANENDELIIEGPLGVLENE